MTTLLIVGAGPLQVPAYVEAKVMGLRTVAIDRNPDAPGMALADAAFVVDTGDAKGAVEISRREGVEGALTLCTDFPMVTVAAVNEALGLAGLRPEAAARATHKGLMREAFERAAVPMPRYVRTHDDAGIARAVGGIGLPAILKPTSSSGSRGVFKLSGAGEMEQAIAHVRSIAGRDGEVLVEEFVDGPEVSVETVSCGGEHHVIAITDKQTTGSPHWIETGHSQPSLLPGRVRKEIARVARLGLDALGIMGSTAHVEIKVAGDSPKIIEIGARLGGDFITTELVPRSTGVNMVRAAIELALGNAPDLKKTRDFGAAIRYLVAEPGIVRRIFGREEALGIEGVKVVRIDVTAGQVLGPVKSSLDRHGHVIAVGRHADEAIGAAEIGLGCIAILTDDGEGEDV